MKQLTEPQKLRLAHWKEKRDDAIRKIDQLYEDIAMYDEQIHDIDPSQV